MTGAAVVSVLLCWGVRLRPLRWRVACVWGVDVCGGGVMGWVLFVLWGVGVWWWGVWGWGLVSGWSVLGLVVLCCGQVVRCLLSVPGVLLRFVVRARFVRACGWVELWFVWFWLAGLRHLVPGVPHALFVRGRGVACGSGGPAACMPVSGRFRCLIRAALALALALACGFGCPGPVDGCPGFVGLLLRSGGVSRRTGGPAFCVPFWSVGCAG